MLELMGRELVRQALRPSVVQVLLLLVVQEVQLVVQEVLALFAGRVVVAACKPTACALAKWLTRSLARVPQLGKCPAFESKCLRPCACSSPLLQIEGATSEKAHCRFVLATMKRMRGNGMEVGNVATTGTNSV